jgi:hypothetical protein
MNRQGPRNWWRRAADIGHDFNQLASRFGYRAALGDFGYRVLRRCGVRSYATLVLQPETLNPRALENPHGFRTGFLSDAQVLDVSRRSPKLFSAEFAARARANGDRCYGVFDRDQLASFGWYSHRPTTFDERFLAVFDPRYVYMHNGYTLPKYRGRHLHALGKAHALSAFIEQGFQGMLSYTESSNHASLRSAQRLGKKRFGRIWYIRLGRHIRVFTVGCRSFGFYLRPSGATEI